MTLCRAARLASCLACAMPGVVPKLSDTPGDTGWVGPKLGEHTDAVLRECGYGDAELRLAPWLATRRSRFFLATKTGDRDGAGARASLERSLDRMGVDSVDLIQMHSLGHPDDWDQAMGPGGALEALVEARAQKLVRFIGVRTRCGL